MRKIFIKLKRLLNSYIDIDSIISSLIIIHHLIVYYSVNSGLHWLLLDINSFEKKYTGYFQNSYILIFLYSLISSL